MAIPANVTIKSALPSLASISAMVPPSLCPITPTDLNFLRRKSIPAAASCLKSSVVKSVNLIALFPQPRSSYLKEAMPLRANASAITANGLCSNSSSSRFCCPLPVTITTTLVFLSHPSGRVSVPLSVMSPFENVTSSVVYGNGGTGVCGRLFFCSPGLRVSGNDMPF